MTITGEITATRLNLRESPGGAVIGTLEQHTRVIIDEDQGKWLKITSDDQIGYVSADYVQKNVEQKKQTPKTGIVNSANNLNFRSSPGGEVIDILPHGTRVSIIEDQGDWLKVEVNGTIGYVSSDYVQNIVELKKRTAKTGIVNSTKNLNFRSSPGGDVIDILPHGARVSILEDQEDWLKVDANGSIGYVSSQFVDPINNQNVTPDETMTQASDLKTDDQPQLPPPQNAVVNSPNGLNFRSSPGGDIIGLLPNETEVQIIEDKGEWLKVSADGQMGFVSSLYIQKQTVAKDNKSSLGDSAPRTDSSQSPLTAVIKVPDGLGLAVYDTPDGNRVRHLPDGEKVVVIEETDQWSKINHEQTIGFVKTQYLQIQNSSPTIKTHQINSRGEVVSRDSSAAKHSNELPSLAGSCSFSGDHALTPGSEGFAKKFKLGLFNYGRTPIVEFLKKVNDDGLNPNASSIRVMEAVSQNEGKFEAINTWDDAFLSFGIFQWTTGAAKNPGELPTLLERLKHTDSSVFQHYFGQFGLDITDMKYPTNWPAVGFFTLKNTLLDTPGKKEALRNIDWAYRFWMAGQNDVVRKVQIDHAVSRIPLFYDNDMLLIRNRRISDYVTSEYGVALLLDQHVNRPGDVHRVLEKAVEAFYRENSPGDPQNWGDGEERKLLAIYVSLRNETHMTDSQKRAETIQRAVQEGLASDRRGAYQSGT